MEVLQCKNGTTHQYNKNITFTLKHKKKKSIKVTWQKYNHILIHTDSNTKQWKKPTLSRNNNYILVYTFTTTNILQHPLTIDI
jgi:hypothetical protein